ncbi:hypothetical protein [Roseovarius sp. MBR-6]|uniref:hypothetical protein n=1 Tax=Roseovarius sp. MBR-6 TaxID=3156459 RepID=UPI003393D7C7
MTALAPVPLAEGLWTIEGATVRWRLKVPMPLRTVVARIGGGALWVHAPGPLTPDLRAWLADQGRVAHLVLPRAPALPWLDDWRAAFPEARLWQGEGLSDAPWRRDIRALTLRHGANYEHVFCHLASRSAILSRLIIAVDTAPLPPWARPLLWLAGIDDSDGKPPPRLPAQLGGRKALGDMVEQVLDWGPERLILTHGRIYPRDAKGEMTRAMRRIMRDRLWDRALSEAKRG